MNAQVRQGELSNETEREGGPERRSPDGRLGLAQDEGHAGEAALGSGLLYGCLVGICPASGGPWSPPQRRHSPPVKRGVAAPAGQVIPWDLLSVC